MSVPITQQVDLLYKQAFGVTKTDTANNKSPSNESIPSPLLIRGDTQWVYSNQIPATAAAVPNIVQAYTGASAVQMVADTTTVPIGGIYPTWLTNLTYWIPQEFGPTYVIKIYVDNPGAGNPTVTGTQIFAAGSGGTGEYYFNYQSGVLNFIGETIPAALTAGKVLYAVGYRYIGIVGVTNLPISGGNANIGNLSIVDTTISTLTANSNLILSPNGTGQVTTTASFTGSNIYANYLFLANDFIAGTINANTGFNTAGNILANNIQANSSIVANGNVSGNNLSASNTLSVTGNANIGNIGTGGELLVSGNANVTKNVNANNIILAGTGTVVNASSGNILTNEVTGTKFNFLNGLYTATITGQGASSNYTLNLPANAGSNGQVLTTDGTSNLSWVTLSSSSISNGNSNVSIPVANGNVNMYANGNNTVVITDTGVNVSGTFNATGNANVGNLQTTGLIATGVSNLGPVSNVIITGGSNGQVLSTNGSGNLTWVSISSSSISNGNSNVSIPTTDGNINLSAAGNANVVVVSGAGANITGYVTANGNGTFGGVKSNSVTAQGGNLQLLSEQSGNSFIELKPYGNGTVDVANFRITSLAAPNASSDAATKQYVDDVAQGLHVHAPCKAATPDTLANITVGTITYNNGSSGVGANLVTTGSFNLIDTVNVQTAGTRILVKNESNAAHNGIYTWANSTTIVRATDFDTPTEMAGGDFTFVQQGNVYNDTGWVMTDPVSVVGTDPVVWVQFSGAGTYQAGAGLTLTGTVFSVNVDNVTTAISGGNVVVKASAQLTTPNIDAATGTSVDLTANVLANNVNANNKVTANNVDVTSNVTSNNVTINLALGGNTANFSGNLTAANVSGGNVVTANYFTGALTTNAQPNITSVGTLTSLNVSGNGTFGNILGPLANGNSNVSIPAANGNVNISAAGNANIFIVKGTGANVTGTLGVSGNANVGNIGAANGVFTANVSVGTYVVTPATVDLVFLPATSVTRNYGNLDPYTGGYYLGGGVRWTGVRANSGDFATTLNVTGNATVGNLIGPQANGNSNVNIPTANGNVTVGVAGNANVLIVTGTGINVAGTGNFSGNLAANNFTVGTGSGGNLTGANLISANTVNVATTLNVAGVSNLGAVGNVIITGGSNGQVLSTNGSGNLSWISISSSSISNGNSNVSIPAANGNVTISVTGTSNVVTITQTGVNVSGTIGSSGNITGLNLIANNQVSSNKHAVGTTMITYGNVVTSSITANQTIAEFPVSGFVGVQYLVRAVDSTGSKYSVATVQAVTDGTSVDYATYGAVNLNGATGVLAVNISGSNIALQVTPASTNTTTWITQYRLV
jgi:hypothetical protein